MKIKVPEKLYRTKLDKFLGRVSPSRFYYYLLNGDPEIIEFAKITGWFEAHGWWKNEEEEE